MNSESQKDDAQTELVETKADFRHVLKLALHASNLAANTPTNRQGDIADTLMLRNILAGISINQLLEPASVAGISALACPDPFSIGALARSVAETYLTMFGVACQEFDEPELEFRLLWWDWYDVNERIRTRDLIKSSKPGVEKLDERKIHLTQKLSSHSRLAGLPDRLKKDFERHTPVFQTGVEGALPSCPSISW